jgi:hypothetical protein
MKAIFWPILKVRAGHCGCNICPKNLKFLVTCGLVLASRYTNFYKIPIFSLGAMPQKQNYFDDRAARAAKKKTFYFLTFWVEFFS